MTLYDEIYNLLDWLHSHADRVFYTAAFICIAGIALTLLWRNTHGF